MRSWSSACPFPIAASPVSEPLSPRCASCNRLGLHARSVHLQDALGWLGILAGAAVFVAARAVPLDDPALVVAVAIVMWGGRLILAVDS